MNVFRVDHNARKQTALWAAANWHRRRGYIAGRPQRRLVSTRVRVRCVFRAAFFVPNNAKLYYYHEIMYIVCDFFSVFLTIPSKMLRARKYFNVKKNVCDFIDTKNAPKHRHKPITKIYPQ